MTYCCLVSLQEIIVKTTSNAVGGCTGLWTRDTVSTFSWSLIANGWEKFTQLTSKGFRFFVPGKGYALRTLEAVWLAFFSRGNIRYGHWGIMQPSCPNFETHWVRLRYNSNSITIGRSRDNIRITCPIIAFRKNCTSKLKRGAINRIVRIEFATFWVPAQLSAVFFWGNSKFKLYYNLTSQRAGVGSWNVMIWSHIGLFYIESQFPPKIPGGRAKTQNDPARASD